MVPHHRKVSGNTVSSRVRGQGHFTGTMVTPQGSAAGCADFGKWLDHCFRFAHIARVPEVGILCS